MKYFLIGEKRDVPPKQKAFLKAVSVVKFVLNKMSCFYDMIFIISSVTWCVHTSIKKSSIEIHHMVCVCVCALMCLVQRPPARKGIIIHMTERDLGRCSHCSFCFCLVAYHTSPTFETNVS